MMHATYQPSLLDVDTAVTLGPLDESIRRYELTDGAWIDHLPGWARGSDMILQLLMEEVDWRAERRRMYDGQVDVPRLLRWYDGHEELPHELLAKARERLSAHYAEELGEPFVTVGMCLYRTGRDSVAWHGDTKGRGSQSDTMVAIVSFGAARPLMLRPRGGGSSRRFPLGHGDLIVMGGSCQRTWEHAIPKTSRAIGPRVSVQFRPVGVA
jgi:alkylated DNA repair dioxygenase AlkB